MYDPLKMAEEVAKVVCQNDQRKYYRFRSARFYGGIATGDCVGCWLRCIFCWSWPEVINSEAYGRFYAPPEVAKKLIGIARKRGFDQIRISGNEPTLCREHLIRVLELIPEDLLFILETNGILIGYDEDYAEALSRFANLHVRVSLKGCCEEEFSRLTGADPQGFALQIKALDQLARAGVSAHAAVMASFSTAENLAVLRQRLAETALGPMELEVEEVLMYRDVAERLKKAGF